MKRKPIAIALFCVICLLFFQIIGWMKNSNACQTADSALQSPANSQILHSLSFVSDSQSDWKHTIQKVIDQLGQRVVVYYRDLEQNEEYTWGNGDVYPSSVIKLFVMAYVSEQIEKQILPADRSTLDDLRSMIIESSNDAYNALILRIGEGDFSKGCQKINDRLHQMGFSDTTIIHSLHPSDYDGMRLTPEGANMTSVTDCGRLLTEIYRHTCISQRASSEMNQILEEEQWGYFELGLPKDIKVANKVGDSESDDIYYTSDAAIIYRNEHPFVLVAFTACDDEEKGPWLLKTIASIAYYQTPSDQAPTYHGLDDDVDNMH